MEKSETKELEEEEKETNISIKKNPPQILTLDQLISKLKFYDDKIEERILNVYQWDQEFITLIQKYLTGIF